MTTRSTRGFANRAVPRRLLLDVLALLNVCALVAGALQLYLAGADWRFVVQSVVVVVAFGAFWVALRRLDPPIWAVLMLQAMLVVHFIGRYVAIDGQIVYGYRVLGLRVDKMVHAVNSMGGSVLVLVIARRARLQLRGWEGFFVVMTVCGLGTLIELIEYGTSVFAPVSFAGTYANNMQDLVGNLLGATFGYYVGAMLLPGDRAVA